MASRTTTAVTMPVAGVRDPALDWMAVRLKDPVTG